MKKSSAVFLQTVVVLLGIAVFVFLLWEPHVEGRNAHATLFEIYFKDAFLACAYIASIPFFVAIYQAFKLFGDVGRNGVFSKMILPAVLPWAFLSPCFSLLLPLGRLCLKELCGLAFCPRSLVTVGQTASCP